MPRKTNAIHKQCERCGVVFYVPAARANTARFCSRACWRTPRITLTCQHCGISFQKPDNKQCRAAKYCSKKCFGLATRGTNRISTHESRCKCALSKQLNPILSADEQRILAAFEAAGLHPIPQYALDKFNIDFAFPDSCLAVEYNGGNWHTTESIRRKDQAKAVCLALLGWELIVLPRLRKPESTAGNVGLTTDQMVDRVRDALNLRQAA